ncbi:hypothetical protein EMCRGX_G026447 [Ephydatia muelleri]
MLSAHPSPLLCFQPLDGWVKLQPPLTSTEQVISSEKIGVRHNRQHATKLTLQVSLEARCGLTPGLDCTCPADVLVMDWAQGKPAAFDITVTSSILLAVASLRVGTTGETVETRTHTANDPKCAVLAVYIASASSFLSGAFPPITQFTHSQTIAMFN